MTTLWNDFETKSRIDITKQGGGRYFRDPSTRVLMLAYAFDNEKVQQWVPAEGQKMPRDLRDAIRDPRVKKSAFNAGFEMGVWQHVLGEEVVREEWRCTMVHGHTLSFPGKLEKVGPIVDLPSDKQKDARGKALIRKFCMPRKPTPKMPWEWNTHITHPDEWEEFKDYNRQDVVAERAIFNRIKKWDLPPDEWEMWFLDQEINDDGIPLNMRVVARANEYVAHIRAKRYARIRKLTGVENPRSNPQMLDWLRDHGYRFDDLKAGHVKRAAQDDTLSEKTREVLTLRSEVAKTSVDKFAAMERIADPDEGVLRGQFQFAGAPRTWRWSGRGIQPQNLARPHPAFEDCQPEIVRHLETLSNEALDLLYEKNWRDEKSPSVFDFLSSCIRPTIQAPKGQLIFSADLNAIENRVLGYLAQDQKILDVFRKGRDPYVDFAAYMYGTSYDIEAALVAEGNKSHRTISKPGVLGCGYMLSAGEEHENTKTGEIEATGLLGYAWQMGVSQFTLEDSKKSVKVWRGTFEDAVEFWWEIDKAAKKCVRTGKRTYAGSASVPLEFDISGPFMRMRLPSGRYLHYCRPRIEESITYFCEVKRKHLPEYLCKRPDYDDMRVKENITYEGLDERKNWRRIHTHPGKLTENADQAISRDLLKEAMLRFKKRVPRKEGRTRLHVHDEIVGMGPEKFAERNYKILVECMSEPMPWASEKELPLAAKGSITKVWIKD